MQLWDTKINILVIKTDLTKLEEVELGKDVKPPGTGSSKELRTDSSMKLFRVKTVG